VPIVFKSGSLNLLEPPRSVQACNGPALPLPLPLPLPRIRKLLSITTKVYRTFRQCLQGNAPQVGRIRPRPLHCISHVAGHCAALAQSSYRHVRMITATEAADICRYGSRTVRATCLCDQRSTLAYCMFPHNSVLTCIYSSDQAT
jgi:hypothetical protein